MNTLVGILFVALGVAYPMAAVVWLSGRVGRQPTLTPRRLGMILALDGILPIALIFWGLGLLIPSFGSSLVARTVAVVSTIAAIALLIMLRWFAPALSDQGQVASTDRTTSNGG